MYKRDFNKISLFFFLLVSLVLGSCGQKYSGKKAPVIKEGVLDLSDWSFISDGPIELEGEAVLLWKSFPLKNEIPALFEAAVRNKKLIALYSRWDQSEVTGRSNFGYASYIIKVIAPENYNTQKLALSWSDGQIGGVDIFSLGTTMIPFSIGKAGKNERFSINFRGKKLESFIAESKEFYLIYRNSNFLNYAGGSMTAINKIEIGKNDDLLKSYLSQRIELSITFGILFMLFFYHLVFYLSRRSDLSNLFLSLTCLSVMLRILTYNNLLHSLVPIEHQETYMRVAYWFEYFAMPLSAFSIYFYFKNLVPELFENKSAKILVYGLIPYFLLCFAPYFYAQKYTNFYLVYILGAILYMIFKLIIGLFRKEVHIKIICRKIFLFFILFCVAGINDLIFGLGYIDTMPLTNYGILVFFMGQSYILSSKFNETAKTAEYLSENLKKEVRQQTLSLKISKDAAEEARLEAEELRSKAEEDAEKLKELDKQKTHFFQNISHELRTPLTLIMNPLDEAKKVDPANENVSVAAKNAKRLYRLVNQLLDFQKIDAGKKDLNLSKIELTQFLKICGDYFKQACKSKKLDFSVSFLGSKDQPEREFWVMAEIDSLEKVIFNYLSNALKYTPQNGAIELGLELETDIVKVFVKDTGPGLSEEQQKKLFKAFSQVDESTTREFEGTGLGLALVKELALKMNGDVFVDSVPGKGSSFGITLPLDSAPKKLFEILVVDDDDDMRFSLKGLFSQYFEESDCVFCSSALKARALLAKNDYKIVLSDAQMPEEDGISLLNFVKEEYPLSKRVLITGYANNEDLKKATNQSKIDYLLYKPWDTDELITSLKNLSANYDHENTNELDQEFQVKEWQISGGIEENEDPVEEQSHFNEQSFSRELILVVDDLKDMRNLIANALKKRSYPVIMAENGKVGFEIAKSKRPRLIISDWMMPIMSGPDMIKSLRNDEELNSTPVILLTAKSDEESKIEAAEIGADAFLGKPFNEVELSSTVRNLLQLKAGEQKIQKLNRHITENILKKYLSPDLVDQIIKGEVDFRDEPKRLDITVLFSDLSGFTKLASKKSESEIAEILNDYLKAMNEIIFNCKGTIDKFMGDGIMVLFGAPVEMSRLGQIDAASECAFLMSSKLEKLNRRWKAKDLIKDEEVLKMRIGIHAGPALVGNFGSEMRSDYTAIGNNVNLAARIEGVCRPDSIFCSEPVTEVLHEDQFKSEGEFELKGVEGKTELFSLVIENL